MTEYVNDIEKLFYQDSYGKKKIARGASARASRKRGLKGQVKLPTDYLSNKQIKELSGGMTIMNNNYNTKEIAEIGDYKRTLMHYGKEFILGTVVKDLRTKNISFKEICRTLGFKEEDSKKLNSLYNLHYKDKKVKVKKDIKCNDNKTKISMFQKEQKVMSEEDMLEEIKIEIAKEYGVEVLLNKSYVEIRNMFTNIQCMKEYIYRLNKIKGISLEDISTISSLNINFLNTLLDDYYPQKDNNDRDDDIEMDEVEDNIEMDEEEDEVEMDEEEDDIEMDEVEDNIEMDEEEDDEVEMYEEEDDEVEMYEEIIIASKLTTKDKNKIFKHLDRIKQTLETEDYDSLEFDYNLIINK